MIGYIRIYAVDGDILGAAPGVSIGADNGEITVAVWVDVDHLQSA
jgi:hypothetical protein